MSHFTVLVIGENHEEQLAKYDENLVVPQYVEKTKQEAIDKERSDIKRYAETTYAEYLKDPVKYKEDCIAKNSEGHFKYVSEEFPKKLTWSDDELYAEAIKYKNKNCIGPNGEILSEYNPLSKWDWYSVGGRWAGFFKLKEGANGLQGELGVHAMINNESYPSGKADQARKKDIDWDWMRNENMKDALVSWEKYLTHLNENGKNDFWVTGVRDGETKEQFIKRLSSISTFAVVKDGKWYEQGEMGWWGIVSDEKDSEKWNEEWIKLVDSVSDDTLLTVVDCHI